MKVFLMVDGSVVFDGEWPNEQQATSALLTAAQLIHNLGVSQGTRVIKNMDDRARAQQQERRAG